MSDPLSISASVAGLITTADIVFRRIYEYAKAVKGAQKEIAALSSEVTSLFGVLHSLHLVICQLEGQTFESTARTHHIYSCHQTLEKIKAILEKHDPSSASKQPVESAKRKLQWPFSTSETKNLIAEVERHKTTLSLALTADGMSALLQALSRQDEIQEGIKDINAQLRSRQEAETRIGIDDERRRILDYFSTINFRKNHETALKLRHPATGIWLTDGNEFRHWLATKNASLWLFGIPGAGKTVLASSVIEESLKKSNNNTAVAFFYCDYKVSSTQDPISILGCLAVQIARQDEQSFEKLQDFYHRHNPDGKLPISHTAEELCDLILEMTATFDDAMIIVDALDECGSNTRYVVELLASLNIGNRNNTKTLFLSRDEQDIREVLEDYTQISIAAKSSDLRLYVGAEIDLRMRKRKLRIKDASLKEHIMERLIEGADGMFRWVACQMDYLCELPNDAARRVALDSLPPDLKSTYERILDRVEASNTEVQNLVQRSLRWIICSETPLSLDALCEVVSVNEGDVILRRDAITDEEEILRWCSSLLRKSAAGDGLELAHFTVKEFLLSTVPNHNDRFAGYRIHSTDVHAEMGKICLTYLCLKDFNIDPAIERKALLRLQDTYPFWSYAAAYWPSHAREHLHDESLFSLAQKLFDPLKSKNFLSWAQTFILDAYVDRLEEGLDSEKRVLFEKITQSSLTATPLHYAAMLALPHLCDWLLQKGCDVNQSSAFGRPLHCAVLGKCAPSGCADDPLDFDSVRPADLVKDIVTLFIGAGADVHCSFSIPGSSSHYSLVKIGLLTSSSDVVRLLLKAGAIFDRSCIDWISHSVIIDYGILGLLEEVEEKNLQEKDLGDFLRLRPEWRRTEAKKFIITKGPQSNDTPSCPTDDRALFLTATEFGQAETLKSLFLHRELNADEELDAKKRTALHIAAEKGFSDIIELLLERGANAHSLDCKGRTPLHHAAEAKDSRCISLLLEHGCDAAQVDHQGLTVWHLAALCDNIEALEILATRAAGTLLSTSGELREGKTALLCAAQAGSEEGIKILLKLKGSLSDKSYDGSTVLHYAAKAENSDAFQALLSQGLDPHTQTKDGSSVLHYAAEGFSSRQIVDLLIERGADPCIQRKDGATPIHLLCQGNKANEFSISKEMALEKLVEVAKTLDQTNNEGSTALHLICRLSQVNQSYWVQRAHATLLANGADPTIKDGAGKSSFTILLDAYGKSYSTDFGSIITESERILSKMMCATLDHIRDAEILNEKSRGLRLLSLAISYVDADMTAKMLEYPVDVDAKNDDQYQLSALELACIFGCHPKLFKTLLERSRRLSDRRASGSGLIHLACEYNANTDLVSALLEAGANPSMRGFNNKTPLMFAAKAGKLETLSLLLSHGADVSMVASDGWSAAHFAALGGHEMILQALTQTKIEFARTCSISWIGGRSSGANMLHIAASKGKCTVIEYILDNQLLPDVNAGTDYQETALLFAAGEGHYRVVESLLSRGANANIKHSTLQASPLHVSSHFGREPVVRLLLDRGCDARTMDVNGLTAELYARRGGHTAVAELLREYVSNQDERKGTNTIERSQCSPTPSGSSQALGLAIQLGDVQLCERLIEEGADLDLGMKDCLGCIPVLYALHHNRPAIAERLIKGGASISGATCKNRETQGFTALHYAARGGYTELLQLLLARSTKSDVFHLQSAVHPIHLAVASGNIRCLELLLDHCRRPDGLKASPTTNLTSLDTSKDAEKENVSTPAQDVATYQKASNVFKPQQIDSSATGNPSILTELQIDRRKLHWQWQLSSAVTTESISSGTALHVASLLGNEVAAKTLLGRGALVDSTDEFHRTPLHFAATNGHVRLVQLLLTHSANPNARDGGLQTPGLYAAACGQMEILQILISHGADLDARDLGGRGALHLAVLSGRADIFSYLTFNGHDLAFKDMDGRSPILDALISGSGPLTSFVLNYAPLSEGCVSRNFGILHIFDFDNERLLKRVLKRIPKDDLTTLINYRTSTCPSPLYAAASMGNCYAMRMLLDAGAQLDIEGGDFGSPLMAACAIGRLPAVKMLVRLGARLAYIKENGIALTAFEAAKHHPAIVRWLLVGRLMEHPKLLCNEASKV